MRIAEVEAHAQVQDSLAAEKLELIRMESAVPVV